ncbi:hypothetical protein MUP00_01275 [Candidatus Bathyarchaeota archaeon]|jgi:hypothetical protein|nr:hypothetical protein [Candidatus Bathyarchaeota archaeon]
MLWLGGILEGFWKMEKKEPAARDVMETSGKTRNIVEELGEPLSQTIA